MLYFAESVSNVAEKLEDSLTDMLTTFIDFVPNLVVALVLVILGTIIAKVVSKVVTKVLGFVEGNKAVKDILSSADLGNIKIAAFAGTVAGFLIKFVFYIEAVNQLNLDVLTDTVNAILGYVPNVFAAAVTFAVVYVAANIVSDVVGSAAKNAKVSMHAGLAKAARVVVLIFGVPLAAAQLNMDLAIINNNITLIVAGVMAAFALAFGLGGRDVAAKVLEDLHSKAKK